MNPATFGQAAAGKVRFAGCELDFDAALLRDAAGKAVELRPQVWGVLRELALHSGQVVTKEDLLASVWPGLVVTDGSIAQAISDARAALGEAGHQVIRTVPRRGYMLVAETDVTGAAASATPASAEPDSQAQRPSVAVLPFGAGSGEPAAQQLARGLAQDVIAELARNVNLRVISHHSSFALGDAATPLAELGKRLGTRHVVDGSVRREGESLHVVMELVDSEGGDVLWSQRYTATSTDAIAHRNALVERIAGTVLSRVSQMRERAALTRPAKNMDVYTMTLRGIALRREATAVSLRQGRGLLEQALATDPGYARAWVALGHLNYVDIWSRLTGERRLNDLPEAAAQVERGIELGLEDAEAHISLCLIRRMQRRFAEALAEAQRAVEVGPSDVYAWQALAESQLHCGQCEAALHSVKRILEFNPMPSGWNLMHLATVFWANRRYDEAIRFASEAHVKVPSLWLPLAYRLYALYESGRVDEARKDASRLLTQLPRLTAAKLAQGAGEAVELQERIVAAAQGSGLP